ncbi:MAG: radical SAM protein [Deltaproteobacteria bacterium SG8_13]|nr:MAG: radical SAM protein [Deltaproteobacteria bacterium SG8_13]
MIPAYIETIEKGLLRERIVKARKILKSCSLCPRRCGVDRLSGETGICKTAAKACISSFNPHFGEEAPLVGTRGSGTIFFTHCNLMCVFCQNYDISHQGYGQEAESEQLAAVMLELQRSGCHNINFVTPTHVVPQILEALEIAVEAGLRVPLVYNSGGYDRVSTLRLLDGVVDIYMPDFKFWDEKVAADACDAPDYPQVARRAIIEMHRQVGDLVIDESGVASRGVLIRHLVLPAKLAGTREGMRFIAGSVSPDSYVNIMAQYRPCGRADEVEGLDDYPTTSDHTEAVRAAKEEGIRRLDRPRRTFMLW